MAIIINEAMYVCRTGKLHQYYTLYIERSVINDGFCLNSYRFVQNLSKEEGAAWDKAKEMYDNRKEVMTNAWGEGKFYLDIDMIDSPKREYCDLKAFGYEWKKTPKGFMTTPDKDFWTIWRQFKSILKEAGFSVFKNDHTNCFVLFFRNTTNEEMVKAFEKLQLMKDNQVIVGNYVGQIKDRVRDIKVIVDSVYERQGAFGTVQVATFSDDEHNIYKTWYSGTKKIEKDAIFYLTGTVKDHKVYDGTKVTVLNRILF